MIYKIKTSKETMNFFSEIQLSIKYAPYILSKLAIALAVSQNEKLTNDEKHRNTMGLELNRQTICGEYDLLFKCLIEQNEGLAIEEDEYFQTYLRGYLNKGAKILYQEFKYNRDFIKGLLSVQTHI